MDGFSPSVNVIPPPTGSVEFPAEVSTTMLPPSRNILPSHSCVARKPCDPIRSVPPSNILIVALDGPLRASCRKLAIIRPLVHTSISITGVSGSSSEVPPLSCAP